MRSTMLKLSIVSGTLPHEGPPQRRPLRLVAEQEAEGVPREWRAVRT